MSLHVLLIGDSNPTFATTTKRHDRLRLRTSKLRRSRGDEVRRQQGTELCGWLLMAGERRVTCTRSAELLTECTHAASM